MDSIKPYFILELERPTNRSAYLVHHWPLNGNGLDIVGGAHATSSQFVAPTENRFNHANKAVQFAYGFYRLPSGVYITNSDFTATVWVKIARHSLAASVFDFGNGPYSDNIVFEVTSYSNNNPSIWLMNGVSTAFNALVSSTVLNLNTWYHLACVFERNTMYLYRDGVIIATRPNTTQARNIVRKNNFIGFNNFIANGDEPLIGVMDDLRIYYKALTVYEIMQIMKEVA
ncbi:MAG: LamG domain-containing protein [Bacteroidetes bacterium]|nr:LamG domain-containing protein [Bacteroidota bacterium]